MLTGDMAIVVIALRKSASIIGTMYALDVPIFRPRQFASSWLIRCEERKRKDFRRDNAGQTVCPTRAEYM